MALKNLYQLKETGEGGFGSGGHTPDRYGKSYQPLAANQPSFLRGFQPSPSIAHVPPPSFLTKTPPGMPYEETITPFVLPSKPEGYTQDSFRKFEEKRGDPKNISKLHKGNKGNETIYRWGYWEVRQAMNKKSMMSLVLGLVCLGALFFLLGFLAAVATLKPDGEGEHNSQSAWQASNEHLKGGHGMKQMAGGLLTKAIGKPLASLDKTMGGAKIIPRPLQPFARYGTGVMSEGSSIPKQANPFPHHQGTAPASYGYPQQPPYGIPPSQSYGIPSTPVSYQQPIPQGSPAGYSQGYPPPMIGPQPSYPPQPVYQSYAANTSPPLPPQPHQVMGQTQYPSYPPQTAYPQGYYR